MVDLVRRTCGDEGCFKRPSYGVAGSTKAEFCSKHAQTGNVKGKGKCGYEGCFTFPSFGVAGSKKTEFCSKHARVGMVNVKKQCSYEGCFTVRSYGVEGSKTAEFCSKHARVGMVNVKNKKCGYEGCSTMPSYGVAGSKTAEFCSNHARVGMVNVKDKKCGYEGCSTMPSYGVAGSKKVEFCSKHATAGMVSASKKCGYEGCSTRPSFGVAGTKTAKFCFKHARRGMVNVKKCGHRGCSTRPSSGVAGSEKAEFCAKHARVGMIRVKKSCGDQGCSTHPSYDVVGSKKADFCFKHARAGIVNVRNERYREEECSASALDKKTHVDEAKFSRQHLHEHVTAMASDTTKLNTGEGSIGPSAKECGGESVRNSREVKRKRAALSASLANDSVGTRRSVCTGPRQGERTSLHSGHPPLLSVYPPSTTDGLSSGVSAGAAMKIELAVPTAESDGDGEKECRKQVVPLRGESRKRGNNGVISSVIGSTGRLCGSPAVVSGYLGTFDDVAFEGARENSNVKFELGVSSPAPRTSDTW